MEMEACEVWEFPGATLLYTAVESSVEVRSVDVSDNDVAGWAAVSQQSFLKVQPEYFIGVYEKGVVCNKDCQVTWK